MATNAPPLNYYSAPTDDLGTDRLRYFDNEFLGAQDFIDEQMFHIKQRRRGDRLLRISGVAEGLSVIANAGTPPTVTVKAGTAYDSSGCQIILKTDATVAVPANIATLSQCLYVQFTEVPAGNAQTSGGGADGANRFVQQPAFNFAKDGNSVPAGGVALAQLSSDGTTLSAADVRQPSGLRLSRLADPTTFGALVLDKTADTVVAAGPKGVDLGYLKDPGNAASVAKVVSVARDAVRFANVINAQAGLAVADGTPTTIGTGGLSVTGSLTAGGAATFSGPLNANGGLSVASGQGASFAGPVNINGQLVVGNGQQAVFSGPLNANGPLAVGSGQAATFSGPVTANATFTVGNGQAATFSGLVNANVGIVSAGDLVFAGPRTISTPDVPSDQGRLVIRGGEALFLLNKAGVWVGKEVGGNGNLTVEGVMGVGGMINANGGLTVPDNLSSSIGSGGLTVHGGLNVGWKANFSDDVSMAKQVTIQGLISAMSGMNTLGPIHGNIITGTQKNFRIPHPQNPEQRDLVHACLEGPEAAVYYRGEARLVDGVATIMLPDYFEALTRKPERTAQVTPIVESGSDHCSALAASRVDNGRFQVYAIDDRNRSQAFYWEVKAVRADVAPLCTEVDREPTRG